MAARGATASQASAQASTASPGPPGTSTSSNAPSIGPDLHEIQLRYKLAPPTFKTLCTISNSPDRRVVLHKACQATEFRSFPIKQADRGFFREINNHTAIPYPISENISEPWHKAFLLVQIDLQRTWWPNKISAKARKDLLQERGRIYILLDCVLRCLVDIFGQRRDGRGVSVALDVLRSIKAGIWEGSENELLQVEGVGLATMGKLVRAGVKNIKQLLKLEFYHIERLLSRNPPFGHKMLRQLANFPVLRLQFDIVDQYSPVQTSIAGTSKTANLDGPLWIARVMLGYENEEVPSWNKKAPGATLVIEGEGGRLIWFWRGSVKRLADGKELVVGLDVRKGEELKVAFACEEIVGTIIRNTHRA
ncbi:ATP-dependent DNA helicase MER3 [Tolypocladium ophioglossoides CBS 100239]|uniref:ATP-dependent DNA helicase MER3 n=1 Tax=Tolypocladium ophioglossoides (strain CBS 100239) TaxID=1163406 RepID=A0A0L0N2H1_TOLOC|nr:ATP-dependent DNA helicase MER3 [Tolypocladium ophioglossoides CBS 100239]